MPENIALVRRLTEEGFVGGKIEVLDDVVAVHFVDHDPMPEQAQGIEGQRQVFRMVLDGLSNRSLIQDDYLSIDDRVVESWTFEGTHTGEFFGVPATGKTLRIRGIEIWRIADHTLVERWGAVDTASVLEQMGVLSTP
jgi:predicted ester cyclase